MRNPIVLFSYDNPGAEPDVYTAEYFSRYGVDPDAAIAASAGRLKRHTVGLRENFVHTMQERVERSALEDPLARWPVMVEVYCTSWDFTRPDNLPIPCDADGFRQLRPKLADAVGAALNAAVFPNGNNQDFFTLIASLKPAQDGKPSPVNPSSPDLSTGESSDPA